MKKIMMIAPMFAVLAACGQKQVPQAAMDHFARNFPQATKTDWEAEHSGYEAEFSLNGKSCSASYDKQGNFKESEIEIGQSELPEPIRQFIAEKLGGKKIKEIVKGADSKGTVFYEVETGKTAYVFDADGSLTKQESEKEDNE